MRGESDARAEAEDKARAAEATTLRLMSLNKNLLDSYQKLLDDKANDAVGQGRAAAAAKEAAASSRRRMRSRFEDGSDDDDFAGDFDRIPRGRAQRERAAGVTPPEGGDARALARRRRRRGRRSRLARRPRIPAKKTWNWNGPRGTPPPQPPRPSRLHFATPPTTTEKARGADGGADGGAAR